MLAIGADAGPDRCFSIESVLLAHVEAGELDISVIARAAEAGGAQALVVANAMLAMAIDIHTLRPRLGRVMGGLTGPATKPIILRMVYQCAQAVKIPTIGCGGITTPSDAIEYMLAG